MMISRAASRNCGKRPKRCEVIFDVASRRATLKELEAQTSAPDFWEDPNKAKSHLGRVNEIKAVLGPFDEIERLLEEADVMADLADAEPSGSARSQALADAGRDLEVNEAACRMTGYSAQELLGMSITDLLSEESWEVGLAHFKSLMDTGESTSDIWLRCKDGSRICLTISAVKLSETRALGFCKDITERKQADEALSKIAERDRRIADVMQNTLIPAQMPAQPLGYEIATRYQPALSEADVCGDFYDFIDLGDSRIGITIGDVAGKGLLAAARVVAVRHTIRSYAYLGSQPSKVMTLVNDAIFRANETENDTLTAFFGILDTRTGELAYTNAGHEPPS